MSDSLRHLIYAFDPDADLEEQERAVILSMRLQKAKAMARKKNGGPLLQALEELDDRVSMTF